MNRDEWNRVLATKPATPRQRGAVMREFGRLGVADRAERLAISAALLDLGALGSTRDLVMGDAGRLLAILRCVRDRGGLPEVTAMSAADDGKDQVGERVSVAELIRAVAVVLAQVRLSGNLTASGLSWRDPREGADGDSEPRLCP